MQDGTFEINLIMQMLKTLRKSRFGGKAYTEHKFYDPNDHIYKTIVDFIQDFI